MSTLGCGASIKQMAEMSVDDIEVIEATLAQRREAGVPLADAQRQAVAEARAQLALERQRVEAAIAQQIPEGLTAPTKAQGGRGTNDGMASRKDVVGESQGGRSADDETRGALRNYGVVRDAVAKIAERIGFTVFTADDSKVSDSVYLYLDHPSKPGRTGGNIKVRMGGHASPESGAVYGENDVSVVGNPSQRMVDEAVSELARYIGRAVPNDVARRIAEREDAARQAISEGESARLRNALINGPAEIQRLEREAAEWQAKAAALPSNAKKRNALYKAEEASKQADYWRGEIERAKGSATEISATGANSDPGESTGANTGGADRSIPNESPAPNSDGALSRPTAAKESSATQASEPAPVIT